MGISSCTHDHADTHTRIRCAARDDHTERHRHRNPAAGEPGATWFWRKHERQTCDAEREGQRPGEGRTAAGRNRQLYRQDQLSTGTAEPHQPDIGSSHCNGRTGPCKRKGHCIPGHEQPHLPYQSGCILLAATGRGGPAEAERCAGRGERAGDIGSTKGDRRGAGQAQTIIKTAWQAATCAG